jgi:hypothetical protein
MTKKSCVCYARQKSGNERNVKIKEKTVYQSALKESSLPKIISI